MPATKRYHQRSFQTFMGTPRGFIIPNSVKSINYRLLKLGYPGLTLRNMELMSQLGKAGLINDNMVQWYQGLNGVTQSANAVSKWLNLAPSRISLNKNLVQGTAANMPTWLRHTAAEGNYGYLNGTTGNYFSTPDSTAVSITGNIDVRAYVALDNWVSPSVNQYIVAKATSGAQRSFLFAVTTLGKMQVTYSQDGANYSNSGQSALTLPFANFQAAWIRWTLVVATGICTYYTSTDGTNWTLFDTGLSLGATSIFDSTSILAVGSRIEANQVMSGKVYRAQVYNGIAEQGGTLAFDFNPTTYVSGPTFLDSSSNAATITLNAGATVVTASALYFDGVNDSMFSGPFTLAQPITVYWVGKQLVWNAHDIYDGGAVSSMVLGQRGTTPALTLFAGGSDTASNAGLSIQTAGVVTSIFAGASSMNRVNRGVAATGTVGGNVPNGFTLGSIAGASSLFTNIVANEILIYNQAHTVAQQDVIIGYLNEKYNLGL